MKFNFFKNYFTNRDNLCIINIVNGDSPKKLSDFLGVDTDMKEFPNLNQLKKKFHGSPKKM